MDIISKIDYNIYSPLNVIIICEMETKMFRIDRYIYIKLFLFIWGNVFTCVVNLFN